MTTDKAYEAFRAALGTEAVGWVDKTIEMGALAQPERLAHYKVVGGRFGFAKVRHFPKGTVFATSFGKPAERVMARWTSAANNPEFRYHEAAHTFTVPELFEEKHPFTQLMSNFATRFLCADDKAKASAEAALKVVNRHPFIVGDPIHPRQIAMILSRVLGLDQAALEPACFEGPKSETARGEVRAIIDEQNKEDAKLYRRLCAMRTGDRKFVRANLPQLQRLARPRQGG